MSTLAMDAKFPADPTTFKPSIQNKVSTANQRRTENSSKGAETCSSIPFDLTSPSPFGKGARCQFINYSGSQR